MCNLLITRTAANTGFALMGGQVRIETVEQLINVDARRQVSVPKAHQSKTRKTVFKQYIEKFDGNNIDQYDIPKIVSNATLIDFYSNKIKFENASWQGKKIHFEYKGM